LPTELKSYFFLNLYVHIPPSYISVSNFLERKEPIYSKLVPPSAPKLLQNQSTLHHSTANITLSNANVSEVLLLPCRLRSATIKGRRLRLKCDGTRPETRFRPPVKRTSAFKSAGASVQSTTGSRGVRISGSNGSNAGYTMFRGSMNGTGYPLPRASPCAIKFQLDSTLPVATTHDAPLTTRELTKQFRNNKRTCVCTSTLRYCTGDQRPMIHYT